MKILYSIIITLLMCCIIASAALADPPANDSCAYADNAGTLEYGVSMQMTGTTIDATSDCVNYESAEVWVSFTVPACTDITINFCDNEDTYSMFVQELFTECPCAGAITADGWNYCEGNSNPSIYWQGVEAGTYYYPILQQMEGAKSGAYTINIIGAICEIQTGACCADEGMTCYSDVTEDSCQNYLSGTWMGGGSECGEYNEETGYSGCNQGTTTGACCMNNGMDCTDNMDEMECVGIGGTWMGAGSSCGEYNEETGYEGCYVATETGACCADDGMTCYDEVTEDSCLNYLSGTWMGEGSECGEYSEETGYEGCQVSPTGACCMEGGMECWTGITESDCVDGLGGTWMGEDSECGSFDGNVWSGCSSEPVTGACCDDGGMTCTNEVTQDSCENYLIGTWMGADSECGEYNEETGYEGCQENPTGACCYNNGMACYDAITEDECVGSGGTWMGEGSECGEFNEETGYGGCQVIDPTGACCYNSGAECTDDVTEDECLGNGGTWRGEGTVCGEQDQDTGIYEGCIDEQTYEYLPGDANMAAETWPAQTIGGDVTYLVNYFRGLADPCYLDGFYASADATGDCLVVGGDVTYLVNYFRGLADLSYCADYEPAWPTPSDVPADAPDGWPNCD